MMLQSRAVAAKTDVKRYPELAGKRVLIAGAERTFGSGIAKAFARNGARLVLQARRLNDTNRIAGNGIRVFECKPRSSEEIERLVDAAATAHAGLDVAISVTALPLGWQAMLAEDEDAPAAEAMRFPYLAGRRLAERMRLKNIRGSLVTVAALPPLGGEGSAGRVLLAGALATLVRRQAEEFGPYGIRTYGIAAEPLIAPLSSGEPSPSVARTGRSRAVAETALALASDSARFLSGQTLTI